MQDWSFWKFPQNRAEGWSFNREGISLWIPQKNRLHLPLESLEEGGGKQPYGETESQVYETKFDLKVDLMNLRILTPNRVENKNIWVATT